MDLPSKVTPDAGIPGKHTGSYAVSMGLHQIGLYFCVLTARPERQGLGSGFNFLQEKNAFLLLCRSNIPIVSNWGVQEEPKLPRFSVQS